MKRKQFTQPVTVEEYVDRHISNTVAAAGSTNIVGAPGLNRRIVVTSFVVQNESQAATVIILEDGGQERWRCYAAGPGNGLAMNFPANHPWMLRANQPLVINLSGANTCGYSIQYRIEPV